MLSTRHLVFKAVTRKLKPRFLGPIRVEEQIKANTLRLTLSAIMRVRPVFNIPLLQPYQGDYKPPGPIEVEGEAEYEVEKIIHHCSNERIR